MEAKLESGEDPKIEISFSRQGDRLGHVWSFVHRNDRREIMRSLEGNSNDEWPSSPPVQDLLFEERDGYNVVLGLGQAGSAHWSSSFKSIPAQSMIEVEHACRLKTNLGHVGCRYVVNDWHIICTDGDVVLLETSNGWSVTLKSSNISVENQSNIVVAPAQLTANSTVVWGLVAQVSVRSAVK